MSTMIETTKLRPRDLFEMPNGSVYAVEGQANDAGPLQARLWCAHAPDSNESHPPLIDLPPGPVRLLTDRQETGIHSHHAGFVKRVFTTEMNRRHDDQMQSVYANMGRVAQAERQEARERRPWWKKLFG